MAETLRKVLVIDDEQDTLVFVGDTLRRLGYEVVTAETGEGGLKKFKEENPDLIILDVLMPTVDGWDVLERIRADEYGKSVPVIMLTVRGSNKDKLKGYIIGADYYLGKPFSLQALLQAVSSVKDDLARKARQASCPPE